MQEKKAGKGNDVARQREELKALGLRIKVVEGDGNCLFRAVADQVHGRERGGGNPVDVQTLTCTGPATEATSPLLSACPSFISCMAIRRDTRSFGNVR